MIFEHIANLVYYDAFNGSLVEHCLVSGVGLNDLVLLLSDHPRIKIIQEAPSVHPKVYS